MAIPRSWKPGLPTNTGLYLVAEKGENGPQNTRLVRAVSVGPRAILFSQEGVELAASDFGSNMFSYPIPRITERKATQEA